MPKKIYSFELRDKVESQLSRDVLHALAMSGWNAIGVYELVKQELANERRAIKEAHNRVFARLRSAQAESAQTIADLTEALTVGKSNTDYARTIAELQEEIERLKDELSRK